MGGKVKKTVYLLLCLMLLLTGCGPSKVVPDKKMVCILTGNGLKDPDSAIKYSGCEVKKTSSELNDILKAMQI